MLREVGSATSMSDLRFRGCSSACVSLLQFPTLNKRCASNDMFDACQMVRPELRLELLAAQLDALPPEAAAAAAASALLQPHGQARIAAPPEARAGAAPTANGVHAPAANGTHAAHAVAGLAGDNMAGGHGNGAAGSCPGGAAPTANGARAERACTPAAQRQHSTDGRAGDRAAQALLADAVYELEATAGARPATTSAGLAAAACSRVDHNPNINPSPDTSSVGAAAVASAVASGRGGTMGAAGHAAAAPASEEPVTCGEPDGAAAAAGASAVGAHTGDADPASTLVLAVIAALQVPDCAESVKLRGSLGCRPCRHIPCRHRMFCCT